MNTVRIARAEQFTLWLACCRCGTGARGWDRIAGQAYCPSCQEAIVQGESEPLILPTMRQACSACKTIGTVTVQTFPHQSATPVEIPLCPAHLRGLLGRNLNPGAFLQLRQQLSILGLCIQDVFLLHSAFYDAQGRALQPATEADADSD